MKNLFIITCVSLVLCGCVNTVPPTSHHEAVSALSEAADSVNQSLTDLKATEQAAYPPQTVREPPVPASYGMAMPVSVDWSGPIGPLVKKIAIIANYKVHVLGRAPAIPVLVSISTKREELGNVLRDAGYQCGKRAEVIVFPSTRIIELRYAKF